MKKLLMMAAATIAVVACTTQKQTESEKTKALQLMERLDTLRQKGYMFGHQDDTFYGVTWAYEKDKLHQNGLQGP